MDTTGQHHDSLHISLKQRVSFLYSCASFIYQPKQTCRRIFRYIGLRETQASSVRSNDSEEVNNKNADMDCHAVPAPAHQAGGDSMREDPCQQDPQRVTRTTPGASSSGQLEEAGASSSW